MKRKSFFLLLFTMVVVTFAACQKEKAPNIMGTWVMTNAWDTTYDKNGNVINCWTAAEGCQGEFTFVLPIGVPLEFTNGKIRVNNREYRSFDFKDNTAILYPRPNDWSVVSFTTSSMVWKQNKRIKNLWNYDPDQNIFVDYHDCILAKTMAFAKISD